MSGAASAGGYTRVPTALWLQPKVEREPSENVGVLRRAGLRCVEGSLNSFAASHSRCSDFVQLNQGVRSEAGTLQDATPACRSRGAVSTRYRRRM